MLHEDLSKPLDCAVMDCESKRNFNDDALAKWAKDLLGESDFRHLGELSKEQRNKAIVKLRHSGISIRQIERITGLGRSIISLAKQNETK